jgi:spectinomycin phosphotransferase/16S rRNA (guanine(1405)-N(7))-methyltransferase
LLAANQVPLRRVLARYDDLAAQARVQLARRVLTHGEPHPGNTMLTSDGWRLIDWDTVVVAEPERDLWSLDPGDGSILARYREATGVRPLPPVLELYRIRWDLADMAIVASRFRRPHQGTADDEASWELLRSLVEQVSTDS